MVRSDARRNRALLVDAARPAFAEHGFGAALEGVARDAGVGIATLYRHFPTRADLVKAVYVDELDALCAAPERLLAELSPIEALRSWAVDFLDHHHLLAASIDTDPQRSLLDRREASMKVLLDANVAAGTFAPVPPREILMALSGLMLVLPLEDDRPRAIALFDLVLDGLRYRRTTPPTP